MPATLIGPPKQSSSPQTGAGDSTTGGQSGGGQGQIPTGGQGGQQQTFSGQQQTPPSQGWGFNWRTGDVTMPQPAQDWSDLALNEAGMGLPALMGQKARLDAARARLGPAGAASADVAGNVISPTTALNFVGGPELAGAVHEGIKSAATNWNTDENWSDYLKRVGEDTAGGAAWGGLGRGTAALAPVVLPKLAEEGTKAGLTYGAHKLMGGLSGGDVMKEALPLLGLYAGLNKVGEFAGEQTGKLASSPVTRQAIQNLILGGGSALRTGAGPYDRWLGN